MRQLSKNKSHETISSARMTITKPAECFTSEPAPARSRSHKRRNTQNRSHSRSMMTVAAFLSFIGLLSTLIGSCFLIAFCKKARVISDFAYFGPMRIVDITIEPIKVNSLPCTTKFNNPDEEEAGATDKNNNRTVTYDISTTSVQETVSNNDDDHGGVNCSRAITNNYRGSIMRSSYPDKKSCDFVVQTPHATIEWGYEWGCPSMSTGGTDGEQQRVCQSTAILRHHECRVVACYRHKPSRPTSWGTDPCTDEEYEVSRQQAEDCTHSKILTETQRRAPTYNPFEFPYGDKSLSSSLSPSSSWPTVERYGDCSTCTVRYNIPAEELVDTVRRTGFILLTAGLLFVFVSLLLNVMVRFEACNGSHAEALEEDHGCHNHHAL